MLSGKKKKIICIVGQLAGGGTERQLYMFLKHLDKCKYEAFVLVSGNANGKWRKPIESLDVNIFKLRTNQFLNKALEFRKISNELKPDLIFSWSFFTNVYKIANWNVPFIGSLRGDLNSAKKNIGAIKWRLCLLPDKFIVNSYILKRQLEESGVKNERISVISNIFDPSEIPKDNNDFFRIRQQYGIPHDAKVVIGCGRDTYEKNLALFLDVFEYLCKKRKDIFGFIIGSCVETIKPQLLPRGLDKRLFLPGEVTNPFEFYRSSNVFFLSSRTEGLPNAPIEALYCGCRMFAMNNGGTRELASLLDGRIEIFEQGSKANVIAMKILSTIEEPVNREQFNLELFSPYKIMTEYFNILEIGSK